MSFGSYPKAGNLANNLQAADILSKPCQEHGAFCVSPPLLGLYFQQVSSISHYFEREVKHLEYVQQRKNIREQERKEMGLELEKKKVVS